MNPMQASAGRTVYGAGSYAPHKGRVSANGMQGYVQRQLRQQNGPKKVGGVRAIGRDGQSDTRSGLAGQALDRQAAWTGGGKHWTGQQPQGAGLHGHNPGGHSGQQTPVGVQPPQQQPPALVIRPNGTLELPYSPAWSQALLEQMGQYNSDLLGLNQEQQQEGIDFTRMTDAEKQNYVGQQRSTLNNASGSGTVFSTAYGTAALNDAKNHNNQINQLLTDHTASQQAFDSERTAMINAFKTQMRQQALAYAEELSGNAGHLGYGQSATPVRPGQNSSAWAHTKPHHGGKGKGKNKK